MIVIDTDFLSCFFKIKRIDLLFKALNTKKIVIASAVLHELEKAQFYNEFLKLLSSKENTISIQKVSPLEQSQILGLGELESIALAEKLGALLLMNDQIAVKVAEAKGILVLDIPSFLLFCKKRNIVSKEDMQKIIIDLKEKDYYEFSQDVLDVLLS